MNQYINRKEFRTKIHEQLSKTTYQICIQAVSHRPIEVENIISYIKAEKKIAPKRDNPGIIRNSWDKVYSYIIDDVETNMFEINKNFRIINRMGDQCKPYICELPKMCTRMKEYENYVVMSSGGSKQAKKWQYYGYVADYIVHNYGMNIFVIGSKDDINGNNDIK